MAPGKPPAPRHSIGGRVATFPRDLTRGSTFSIAVVQILFASECNKTIKWNKGNS
ncbi:MAG: hypothetical protein ACTSUE_02365 [Promethearchaeota archaeon]